MNRYVPLCSALIMATATAAQADPAAIGCYHRICVGVYATGKVMYFDLNTNATSAGPAISAKGPFTVSCEDSEYCAAVDASGQVWKGPLRPRPDNKWDKGPKL